MIRMVPLLAIGVTWQLLTLSAACAQLPFLDTDVFTARDTIAAPRDASADAQQCIEGLTWQGGEFEVRCLSPLPFPGDALVTFPSAIASGDAKNDRVAMAVLPYVQAPHVSLQGTSLGGFVSATTASLDSGNSGQDFENVFLMLAGGNLMDVIQNGKKDAAGFRRQLEQSGLSMKQVEDIVYEVEPLRIAHRLNPQRTWLFSAKYDQVVDIKNAEALARRIPLTAEHHVRMLANHYSGAVYIPLVLSQMVAAINEGAGEAAGK